MRTAFRDVCRRWEKTNEVHARSLGLTLVTNNTKEFSRVKDLRIEDWKQ